MNNSRDSNFVSRVEQLLLSEDSLAFLQSEIFELGPAAVPVVLDILRQGPHETKFTERALLLLGALGGHEASEYIGTRLNDEEEMVKVAAISALRQMGDTSYNAAVVELLNDASPVVRKEAIKTLAEIGDLANLEPLRVLAESEQTSFLKDQAREAMENIRSRFA